MTPDAAPAPVFVDDSGRRHRAVRVIGWLLGTVMVGYLALLGISLVGSPGIVPLSLPALGRLLPGPAAAPLIDASTRGRSRVELVLPTPPPGTPAARPAAPTLASARPTARRTATPTARPSSSPTATPTRSSQANPSPAGSARPSHGPTAHPSPRSTKHSVVDPSPTPTATAS